MDRLIESRPPPTMRLAWAIVGTLIFSFLPGSSFAAATQQGPVELRITHNSVLVPGLLVRAEPGRATSTETDGVFHLEVPEVTESIKVNVYCVNTNRLFESEQYPSPVANSIELKARKPSCQRQVLGFSPIVLPSTLPDSPDSAIPPSDTLTASISISPERVMAGQRVTISVSTNGDNGFIEEPRIEIMNGDTTIAVEETSTFTFVATRARREIRRNKTVFVYPSAHAQMTAIPNTVRRGEAVTLLVTTNTRNGVLRPGNESLVGNYFVRRPDKTTPFHFRGSVEGGDVAEATALVTVIDPPLAGLTIEPDGPLVAGEKATLSAWMTNADQGFIIPLDTRFTSDSINVPIAPDRTITYILSVVGAGGTSMVSKTVTVYEPPQARMTASSTVLRPGDSLYLRVLGDNVSRGTLTAGDSTLLDSTLLVQHLDETVWVAPDTTTQYVFRVMGPGERYDSVATTVLVNRPTDWRIAVGGRSSIFRTDAASFPIVGPSISAIKNDRLAVTLSGGWLPVGRSANDPEFPSDPRPQFRARALGATALTVTAYPGSDWWGLSFGVAAAWESVRDLDAYLKRAFAATVGFRSRPIRTRHFVSSVGLDVGRSHVSEFGVPGSRWQFALIPSVSFSYVFK